MFRYQSGINLIYQNWKSRRHCANFSFLISIRVHLAFLHSLLSKIAFFWLIESPSLSGQDLSACRPLGRAASHSSQSQYKFRRITPRPLLNSSGQGITLHRSKSHISISPVISQPARKLSQLYRPSPYVLTKLIALPFKVVSLSLSDKRICHHHHYQLIPSATMPQCTHDYKSIKSPNNILLWHCSICHSGPHWFIQQCSICKKKTCSVHAQKDVQS